MLTRWAPVGAAVADRACAMASVVSVPREVTLSASSVRSVLRAKPDSVRRASVVLRWVAR